jgi:CheY-like chemotaxis protein
VTAAARRILVVDDSEIILAAVTDALGGAGFAVTAVGDLAGLEAVAQQSFDLVLMDVQMPQLYGDDVAAVLRHDRRMAGRIYLFSSLSADELAERARDAGLDGYLSKNDGLEALVSRVTSILTD